MKPVEKKRKLSGTGKIEWKKVDAVGIEFIGYDFGQKKLYVKFRTNKKIYIYFDVKEDVYTTLMEQEHKTTFLNKVIKGTYKYDSFYPEDLIQQKRLS